MRVPLCGDVCWRKPPPGVRAGDDAGAVAPLPPPARTPSHRTPPGLGCAGTSLVRQGEEGPRCGLTTTECAFRARTLGSAEDSRRGVPALLSGEGSAAAGEGTGAGSRCGTLGGRRLPSDERGRCSAAAEKPPPAASALSWASISPWRAAIWRSRRLRSSAAAVGTAARELGVAALSDSNVGLGGRRSRPSSCAPVTQAMSSEKFQGMAGPLYRVGVT